MRAGIVQKINQVRETSHVRRRSARRSSQRSRRVLDAVHAQSRVQEAAAPDLALQGHALLHAGGARDSRRDGGAVVLQRRPQPPPDRRGDPAPGGRTRFLAELPVRPSPGVPAVLAPRRAGAGRSRPRVLHQFRLGGRRHGAEDRARLSQRARQRLAPAADRARARLSRVGSGFGGDLDGFFTNSGRSRHGAEDRHRLSQRARPGLAHSA